MGPRQVGDLSAITHTTGPLLGLDPGTKTIGLAISDRARRVATPLETLMRKKFKIDLEAIKTRIQERNITAMVMGLPLNMDGSSGPRAQSVRALGRQLETELQLPIVYWDERWSTSVVEQDLIKTLDTTRAKRAANIDALAAQYILQGALDKLNMHES